MRVLIISLLFLSFSFAQEVKVPGTIQSIPQPDPTGCVSGNCVNGWGKWQYENGHYAGFWSNSKRSGYGLYDWKESGKYIGFWKNNRRHGYGVYFYENDAGDEMSGEFAEGELNGFGKKYINKKWSQGVFEGGKLVTEYTFYDTKKSTGCIAGDCKDKYGRYKWANGDKFTGFFKNGRMYLGTYSFVNGDKYSGMFVNDAFQGDGRFFFKDGGYYGGKWYAGKYDGEGYFTDKDYKRSVGVWDNSVLIESYE